MTPHSHVLNTLENGLILDVNIEELRFTAYVVISEADINLVAEIVPRDAFENGGDLHVTAVAHAADASAQVEDLSFNMNIGDAAVFLCIDQASYQATLEELGQDTYQDRA